METTKRKWGKAVMQMQVFEPQEYCKCRVPSDYTYMIDTPYVENGLAAGWQDSGSNADVHYIGATLILFNNYPDAIPMHGAEEAHDNTYSYYKWNIAPTSIVINVGAASKIGRPDQWPTERTVEHTYTEQIVVYKNAGHAARIADLSGFSQDLLFS